MAERMRAEALATLESKFGCKGVADARAFVSRLRSELEREVEAAEQALADVG